jgi:type 1 glutamine amidotransferase
MRLFISLIIMALFCSCSGKNKERATLLDVLIITDNRSFNREAFFAIFDSFEDVRWTELSHPDILDFFGSDSIKKFDALVFYDMPEEVSPTEEQKQNMLEFFEAGAPAIFLHHALLSYRQWDQFPDIIGGRYYNKTPLITETGETLQSVYQHDVLYKVNIADRAHPITQGVENFDILDEVYNNYFVKEDVDVFLTTDHPLSGRELGWVNTFGNSRVVFLINGHNETAYENPNYLRLLHNAIQWVASNKKN